ncbi:hypothetical protein FWD20_03570 [Candidatus Saccharibacteria bacterium]|nr:hypothetical protein [Candidatus Saccharibacteria bacterium]
MIKQKILTSKIAAWRARDPEQRKTIWRKSLISRVKNSMAMENEPVSKEWLEQAQSRTRV